MNQIEIEIKVQVTDAAALEKFLKKLTFLHTKRVVDVYLDTPDASLYKRGIFARIRDGKTIDFKFNLAEMNKSKDEHLDHTHCSEFSFDVPLQESHLYAFNDLCKLLSLHTIDKANLEEFKKKNNLIESFILDKQRLTYKDDQFLYMHDKVKGLGDFLEIEFDTNENDDVEKIKKMIRQKISSLPYTFINTGYNELYWRQKNFDIYLQGKYILDEDFEKYRKNSA